MREALRGHFADGRLQSACFTAAGAQRRSQRLLARPEGIFAGYSTGANIAAALQLLTAAYAQTPDAGLAGPSAPQQPAP